MKKIFLFSLFGVLLFAQPSRGADERISQDTASCIECHSSITPGIVAAWEKGRMSRTTPLAGKEKGEKGRRVSFDLLPEDLGQVIVGCAECHTLNPGKHRDTFEHNGFQIHTVVTPLDCATCHPVETGQYGKNLMSHAYGNLARNPLYQDLVKSVTGVQSLAEGRTVPGEPDPQTLADACYHCHGTVVQMKGTRKRETPEGAMNFPVLTGWPNQGVGRINPDGSKGSCSSCHARHQFSIEVARKPYTCSQCHKGPDVPAYEVYEVSKHGNLFSSSGATWNFDPVPWTIGKDLTAPTCATCHVSLVVSGDGETVAERTHQMNDRIANRIFGLIYAHPHPKSPDTSIIKNKGGLPLPTELTGEPVEEFLISRAEQKNRRRAMEKTCLACHSQAWVNGHFSRYENTIATTNQMTLTATKLLLSAWEKGLAKGLAQKDSPFNEAIEKKWVEHWLFHANSTRYSSAMMGADYGVFANGRWYLSKGIQEMVDWLRLKR